MKILKVLTESVLRDYEDKLRQMHPGVHDTIISDYIEDFNILKSSGKLPKDARDILKYNLRQLMNVVNTYRDAPSNRQIKQAIKTESIRVEDNDMFSVIIPLSQNSATVYGKNTKWCVSGDSNGSEFCSYFMTRGVTLFFIFDKVNNAKFAVEYDSGDITVYDEQDTPIGNADSKSAEIWNNLQLDVTYFRNMYQRHQREIEEARDSASSQERNT